ncbi:unnamed protein product [Orchesella dallaii]|uniref:Ubiquitin-like protease family profile domain-containing protein n=1 Tax=Orchesella dallaii TaxID=48710 RepID=A0ABP1Q1L2_9HEXA
MSASQTSFRQRHRHHFHANLYDGDRHDFLSGMMRKPVVDVFIPESALENGDLLEDIIRKRCTFFANGDANDYQNNMSILGGTHLEYNVRLIPSHPENEVEGKASVNEKECSIDSDTPNEGSEAFMTGVVYSFVEVNSKTVEEEKTCETFSDSKQDEMICIDDISSCGAHPPAEKKARLSPSSPPPPPSPLLKPVTAPELTDEMLSLNWETLTNNHPNTTISQCGPNKIIQMDLASLLDTEWLSDSVVDFFFRLIQNRSNAEGCELPRIYCFFSTFYALLSSAKGLDNVKETTDQDIFKYDLVFFPACVSFHWRLVVVDPRRRVIRAFNSSRKNSRDLLICKNIQRFLEFEETKQTKQRGEIIEARGNWAINFVENIPQQGNSWDCGVFILQYAEYLSRHQSDFDFSQEHMPYYRQRVMHEIISERLLI